jgi:hypothetical protein
MNHTTRQGLGSRAARLAGLASLVLVGLVLGVSPVAAAAPVTVQFDIYADGPADWLSCGFPVYEVGHDHVTMVTYLNADGSPRETTLRVLGAWTETNLDTGKSVQQNYARTFFNAFSSSPTGVGMMSRINSGGVKLLDAGLITWSSDDGTVLTIAGPHPSFFEGTDWCGLLAG